MSSARTLPLREVEQCRRALSAHRLRMSETVLLDLFAADSDRFRRLSWRAGPLTLDLSKMPMTDRTVALLLDLAAAAGIDQARRDMFEGKAVNVTERRAAWHVALRGGADRPAPEVDAAREAMLRFAAGVRADAKVTDVVHIGIGGSLLGPTLAVDALTAYADGPRIHWLGSVDGGTVAQLMRKLDPARTLAIVASKSFTTQETLVNAKAMRGWFGADAQSRMVAVTARPDRAHDAGYGTDRILPFAEWVGGRFSLWSAVGVPIAIAIGPERFREMLTGAAALDRHFREAPADKNLPLLHGLAWLWNTAFGSSGAVAVLPYDRRLARLVDHLQQLVMESLGKSVDREGHPVELPTAPVVFGQAGTDGQHAFMQVIHQGPRTIPVEFIAAITPEHDLIDHHRHLLANCFAQGAVLMRGLSASQAIADLRARGFDEATARSLVPHVVCPGNRPSSTILVERIDPAGLGALIAFYEHSAFAQGVVLGINPFDQWGVERGKRVAAEVLAGHASDPSTAGLLAATGLDRPR
ncbi:MAG: glucose-6-phosphate isomerase [Alphaproteobacteria bacterium]|nr:glucose-6-phosphate isomerase [Alphaproteobacteria bacterium]